MESLHRLTKLLPRSRFPESLTRHPQFVKDVVPAGRLDRRCRNKPRPEGVAEPRACPDPVDQPVEWHPLLPANSQFRANLMRQGPLAGRYPAVAAMVTL